MATARKAAMTVAARSREASTTDFGAGGLLPPSSLDLLFYGEEPPKPRLENSWLLEVASKNRVSH
jgi:hypothetical protein